ncbi:MAG: carbon-nitrogen hydrolase family protein [Phycisphaerales bacterium]
MKVPENADLSVALIHDVFFDRDPARRLRDRLTEAKERGADLAVLPEIPCNPWSPASRSPRDDDAEAPGGRRQAMQAEAAASVGIGLVGGAIICDPESGQRHNTALIYDERGHLVGTHRKWHIPDEPGFWEADHYEPGEQPPQVIDAFAMQLGVQICSDVNRPEGSHLLSALGAEAIIAPRATEQATIHRWRPVFMANALTSACYVLSVNRPGPEDGVLIGGPSIAISPLGETLLDSIEPVAIVHLERRVVESARKAYPGYLPVRADLYRKGWTEVISRSEAQSSSAPTA